METIAEIIIIIIIIPTETKASRATDQYGAAGAEDVTHAVLARDRFKGDGDFVVKSGPTGKQTKNERPLT